MQPELLPSAAVAVPFTISREGDAAPSWTVDHDHRPVLRAAGVYMPDGVLELVAVAWQTSADDVRERACVTLLKQVLADAAKQKRVTVRTLVWDQQPSLPAIGLESAGFSRIAELQAWTAPMESAPPDCSKVTIQRRPLPDSFSSEQKQSVLDLLHECLAESDDLVSLPKPDPVTLLKTWQSMEQPESITATVDGVDVGLAVLSRNVDGRLATLEYLGVSHHARRQGYGRLLLCTARTAVISGRTTKLVAYCDRRNIPGTQLYQHSGFEPGDIGRIWVGPVEPDIAALTKSPENHNPK